MEFGGDKISSRTLRSDLIDLLSRQFVSSVIAGSRSIVPLNVGILIVAFGIPSSLALTILAFSIQFTLPYYFLKFRTTTPDSAYHIQISKFRTSH